MRFSKEEFFIEASIRKGRKLPEWYVNEPRIQPIDKFYIKSFWDLNTCRPVGMDIGSIPWTAIIKYADWYRLEKDVADAFVDIIRSMDEEFICYQRKVIEANKPKKKKK